VLIIDDIFPEGNVHRDGRLCIGDRILEINGEDFANRSLAEATLALGGVVPLMKLAIYRECLDEGEGVGQFVQDVECACPNDDRGIRPTLCRTAFQIIGPRSIRCRCMS
jgi:hypothetical protein